MFDYIFSENLLPSTQCPNCHKILRFHGGYFPIKVICSNCGQEIDLLPALKNFQYPNTKFNEHGKIIKQVEFTLGDSNEKHD